MSNQYRVQNPVTNEVVKTFEFATDQEIQDILNRSEEAFKTWRNTSYEERVALDRRYVESRSMVRDLAILFRTVGVVLRRKGAR